MNFDYILVYQSIKESNISTYLSHFSKRKFASKQTKESNISPSHFQKYITLNLSS